MHTVLCHVICAILGSGKISKRASWVLSHKQKAECFLTDKQMMELFEDAYELSLSRGVFKDLYAYKYKNFPLYTLWNQHKDDTRQTKW